MRQISISGIACFILSVMGLCGAENEQLLTDGIIPGAIRIPGTALIFKFGGYAKADFNQDLDVIGDPYEFRVNTIPAQYTSASEQGGQTTIHARETRLNFDISSKTPSGAKLRAFFEGDFYGDKNTLRIRHAYGEYGNLLGGQNMDHIHGHHRSA